MKRILTCLLILTLSHMAIAQVFISKKSEFTFFSEAPLENIKAKSEQGKAALNINTGDVYFKVGIRSFQFKKALMQEHFNENYLESDKYPYAEFKGTLEEGFDLNKDGIQPVIIKGVLKIHNVSKEYTVKGTFEKIDGMIVGRSIFNVIIADHHIKIPNVVFRNIAEVVQVSVFVEYEIMNK